MKLSWSLILLLLFRGIVNLSHGKHTSNWAVLVCASRYWFNYRHVANALSMYRSVKRLGIPDSNIILMLADDMACDPRNCKPATIFNNANQQLNLYGDDIEVDYRGYEVTVENFIRVLTGRLDESVPRSKRLLTDDKSNIIVYMTGIASAAHCCLSKQTHLDVKLHVNCTVIGHGGDGFLKFQDHEEISSAELADAFQQMWQKSRYNELMFIIDTCQAASMHSLFYSPNLIGVGSSSVGEDSLSHHMDNTLGVHMIDRWTYFALEVLEKVQPGSNYKLSVMLSDISKSNVKSHPSLGKKLLQRDWNQVLVTDFFGSVRHVDLMNVSCNVPYGTGLTQDSGEQSNYQVYRPPVGVNKLFEY